MEWKVILKTACQVCQEIYYEYQTQIGYVDLIFLPNGNLNYYVTYPPFFIKTNFI